MWKKQRRRELVYLRRSELGARMFGKSQKRVLGKVRVEGKRANSYAKIDENWKY